MKNEKFTLTEIFFSSDQLFNDFFSKTVAFTKFLPKKWEDSHSMARARIEFLTPKSIFALAAILLHLHEILHFLKAKIE